MTKFRALKTGTFQKWAPRDYNTEDAYLQDVSANGNEAESTEPLDIQAIAETVTVPGKWTKLDVQGLDGLLSATTSICKKPFGVFHEKLLLLSTDDSNGISACSYFRGKEGNKVHVQSMRDIADILRQADVSILCEGAVGIKEHSSKYSKHVADHIKASIHVMQHVTFSRSCAGVVTASCKHFHF
ncbi:hypothetical protein MTO96_029623 [Rhipicephalus appendiculatus]